VKSLVGSVALAAFLALVYGGICLYEVGQDAGLAANEVRTTAQIRVHPEASNSQPLDALRCDYNFSVNGVPYVGHGMCPVQEDEPSLKGLVLDAAGVLQKSSVTVYYDPADPSTNSMTEFGAKQAVDGLRAKVSLGLGAGLLVFVVLGLLVVPGGKSTPGGIVVDNEGTVLYPDKIDSDR
jgi:hypothetical protein